MAITVILIFLFMLMTVHLVSYQSGKKKGMAVGGRKPKELEYQCAHVWNQWNQKEISIINDIGRKIRLQTIQERQCEICGYLQREWVLSKR